MDELLKIINSEKLNLSPPWYLIYRDIKSTIGADSFVHVQPLRINDEDSSSYMLDIVVDYPEKAQALATILVAQYDVGVKVNIRIMDIEGKIYYPQIIDGEDKKDKLKDILDKAFASNDLYYGLEDGATMATSWCVVIAKDVIQYYNDDLSDFYKNNNEVASEIFKKILKTDYGEDLKICITTDLNRNVNPNNSEEPTLEEPWKITYYLIKAFLSPDDSLIVRPMYKFSKDTYYIDIQTMDGVKAKALAKIMKTKYDFGNIHLYVRFFDVLQSNPVTPIEVTGKDVYKALTRVIKKAFAENPLINNVINVQVLMPEEVKDNVGNIVLVVSKEVIQIFASDIQDFWGNKNYVAAKALEEIIVPEHLVKNTDGEEIIISVNTTTEYNRDVLD